RHGEPGEVRRIEESDRESFLASDLLVEPVIGHTRERGHDGRYVRSGKNSKRASVLLEAFGNLSKPRTPRSREGECGEIDPRLFSDLDCRETEVGVVMQIARAHFVEHRRPTEVVTALDEETYQLGHTVWIPDRISQRHPRPSLNRVHDERVATVVEDDRFVA